MKILTLCLAALLFAGCASMNGAFYQPNSRVYRTPANDGLKYEAVRFSSADGTELTGWFIPAVGEVQGTVIHFHGNGQNMTAHYSFVSWLPNSGFNLFVFDYRGYGSSAGRPTRQGVYEDSVAALRYITSRADIDRSRIIVFGQSLGGANAIAAVGSNRFDGIVGVVADSAFSSFKSIARDKAGMVGSIVSDRHSPLASVGRISPTPLLIIHGTNDRVVPYHHATRLYKAAGQPKALWTIKDGGHTSALASDKQKFAPRLRAQFLDWLD